MVSYLHAGLNDLDPLLYIGKDLGTGGLNTGEFGGVTGMSSGCDGMFEDV